MIRAGSVRSGTCLLLAIFIVWTAAPARAQAAAPAFEDSIAQRMQACVTCHGDKGGGIAGSAFPRLAGQPAAHLSAQMRAFRDGVRNYAPMNFLMSRQSDAGAWSCVSVLLPLSYCCCLCFLANTFSLHYNYLKSRCVSVVA